MTLFRNDTVVGDLFFVSNHFVNQFFTSEISVPIALHRAKSHVCLERGPGKTGPHKLLIEQD
jgi:hypothetical protein